MNQTDERPDLVALGVPHLSVNELGQLAKILEGRKLRRGVKMYVYTSSEAYDMATRSGISATWRVRAPGYPTPPTARSLH